MEESNQKENVHLSKEEFLPTAETSIRDICKSILLRPELADNFDHISTAEIAANSPRYRRRSSTFIDGVHDLPDDKSQMAPAQLYSTMSGRLFHSGRIAIVLVGPPARGKT